MSGFRSGFVAIVGRPNVGKSTLMNHLIGQKIAITANKPQTTRNKIQTVYTDERGQIVFLDTPGIHQAKNKLGTFMVSAAFKTLESCDAVLWLVEPSEYVGRGDEEIVKLLKSGSKPVILVINKIDTVSKEQADKAEALFSGLMDFRRVMRASALRSRGVKEILSALFEILPEGPMYYDEDTVTNQPMRQICAEMIREKALRDLDKEIPHGIAVTIEKMSERKPGLFDIEASVIVEKESHKGIVIGKNGAMLKRIGSEARTDMEDMLEAKVNLKLWVKVRRDWRDSDIYLKNFGYFEDGK